MDGLRVALVTRTFWPAADPAAAVTASLACEMVDSGARPMVVTSRPDRSWPERIDFRGVPIFRVSCARQGAWAQWRAGRALARWLRRHRDRLDVACASQFGHDACVTLGELVGKVPVVLKVQGQDEPWRKWSWQAGGPFGGRMRRRLAAADAVVVPDLATRAALIAAGFFDNSIRHIPDGVPICPIRGPKDRARARAALAEACPDLAMPDHAPLAVCIGELKGPELDELALAWREVVARWPNARLWLVGEVPRRAALVEQIVSLGIVGRVQLPGAFDDSEDILAAADLYVTPSAHSDARIALLMAMAAGLPVIAPGTSQNRELLGRSGRGIVVDRAIAGDLAQAAGRLLNDPAAAAELGLAARAHVVEHYSAGSMASEYLRLFEELVAGKMTKRP